MKDKKNLIWGIVTAVLVIGIIGCGVVIYNKSIQISNLKTATIALKNEVNTLNATNTEKKFDYLRVSINPNGNNETMDISYKLNEQNAKDVTLNNVALTNKDGKWTVNPNQKLTGDQEQVVEEIANNQQALNQNLNNGFNNQIRQINRAINNMQNGFFF